MTSLISSLSVKPIYQSSGPDFVLGAYGETENIQQYFNLLFNYRAHDNTVCFLSDNFGYVTGQTPQLMRGLTAICLAELQETYKDIPKKKRNGIHEMATEMATEYFNNMKYENFINYRHQSVHEFSEPIHMPSRIYSDIEDLIDIADKTTERTA